MKHCLKRKNQDISAVEILDTDEFKSKVKFLSIDLNYIDGYSKWNQLGHKRFV